MKILIANNATALQAANPDVTQDVLKHVEAVEKILSGDEALLQAGEVFAKGETDLNASTWVSFKDGVIFRKSTKFVNHIYTTPDGQIGRGVVTWNPGTDLSGGAITMSLADPVEGVNCGAILKNLFGPEAGGHAGIGGSPRGQPLPESEALRARDALIKALQSQSEALR